MKHTKGPWALLPDGIHVRAESGRMVAAPIPHPGDCPIGEKYSAEDRANARLLAEAPAMHDKLTVALRRLKEKDDGSNRDIGLIVSIEKLLARLGEVNCE